jgi:hypothetical protein
MQLLLLAVLVCTNRNIISKLVVFFMLLQAFQEDWIAEIPQAAAAAAGDSGSSASQPSFSQQRAATRDTNFGPGAQDQKQEAPDVVRPGRLLTTLHAMRQELEVQLVSAGGCITGGAGRGGG